MAFSVLLSCPPLSDPGPGGHVPQQRQEGGNARVAAGLSLAEVLPPGTGRLSGQDHLDHLEKIPEAISYLTLRRSCC